ncbi:MAG: ABC transporter permease [Bacillota bacterium]
MRHVTVLVLPLAELKRGFKNHLAYPVQAASELVGVGIAAALAAYGPIGVASGAAGIAGRAASQAAGRLIGFMMAFVALAGLQVVHRVVREESDVGTLEQLCLSPVGLPALIGARCFADTLRLAFLLIAALALSCPITRLVPSLVATLAAALLMNAGMLGVGLVIGSLTLVFKRTGFVVNLASIALLPLALSPLDGLPRLAQHAASMVPLTHAVRICHAALGEAPLSALRAGVTGLFVSGTIWLCVGMGVFAAAEKFARVKGLLGKY